MRFRWSVGRLLTAIVVAALVPLGLVVAAAVWEMTVVAVDRQRHALLLTANSIAAAVDAELGKYVAIAEALARSPAAVDGDLEALRAEASRLLPPRPEAWAVLVDLAGQQVLNTRVEPGKPLPIRSAEGLAVQKRALERGAMAVSDVIRGPVFGEWAITVDVPLVKAGQPVGVVVVAVGTSRFQALLAGPNAPKDWFIGIMDTRGRFIARQPFREPGQPTSSGWSATRGQPGLFEITTLEGVATTNANAVSMVGGWTIGVAVADADLQAAAWRTLGWSVVLLVILGGIALALVAALARTLQGALASLRTGLVAALEGRPEPSIRLLPEFDTVFRQLSEAIAGRRAIEHRLEQSEARLRLIADTAPVYIVQCDREMRYRFANKAYADRLGLTVDALLGQRVRDVLGEAGWAAIEQQVERTLAGQPTIFEVEIPYKTIGRRWMACAYVPERRAGEIVGIVGALHDVTDRHEADERLRIAMQEVSHRFKNLLTLVQLVARRTSFTTREEFVDRFTDRLAGLAAAQDLLVTRQWRGVDLAALIGSQLAHFSDLIGTRITLRGAPVELNVQAAQSLGMAFHELATNAGKHGALSRDEGRIDIAWTLDGGQFRLVWRESGGPPPRPDAPKGFGSTVIERMVAVALQCRPELRFDPPGLSWTIVCPARAIVAEETSATP